jgi:cell filamentation protein
MDEAVLSKLERNLTANRIIELRAEPIHGKFDFEHLKQLHGRIFQDMYDWAGQERTLSMRKGSTLFCLAENLDSYQTKVFGDLAKDGFFKGMDPEQFTKKSAQFLGDLNALHPFREGNGRTQREFMRELALNAGYRLELDKVPQKLMTEASIQSYYGINVGLETAIRSQLKPIEPVRQMAGPTFQRS